MGDWSKSKSKTFHAIEKESLVKRKKKEIVCLEVRTSVGVEGSDGVMRTMGLSESIVERK